MTASQSMCQAATQAGAQQACTGEGRRHSPVRVLARQTPAYRNNAARVH